MEGSGLAMNAGGLVVLYVPPEMLARGAIKSTLAKNRGRVAEEEREYGRPHAGKGGCTHVVDGGSRTAMGGEGGGVTTSVFAVCHD